MKIFGFIKWQFNQVPLGAWAIAWMSSSIFALMLPNKVADYYITIWGCGMVFIALYIIGNAIRKSYKNYLKEQQDLINRLK